MLWTGKARPQAGALADRPRGRVLVVEDAPTTRMFLEDALSLEGYEVRTAADGADGLVVLRQWRPDAIVLDVSMPNVDAPVFRAVQFDSSDRADVPVLLLSGMRADRLERMADDLGAAAWLTKPCDVDALTAQIARLAAG
jgi:DNA-binding response OmpR family regulator